MDMRKMGVTISTHNGSVVAREHNIRNEKVTSKESHIDPNGVFEVWHDEKVRDAYHRLFDEAVEQYNAKQTRPDRRIKNYYKDVCDDVKKHAAYEMIIAVGCRNGETIDDSVGKEIMREFVDGWRERNPNLEMIGAYYHADEQGVPHVHIDYVPVAHGYTKGMATQNGLVKALSEMGFEKQGRDTAQIQWERRENECLDGLCRARGLEVDHPKVERAKHLATELYKALKALEEAQEYVNTLEEQVQHLEGVVRALKGEEKEQKDLQKEIAGTTFFGKTKESVTIPYTEYRTLQRIARETNDLKSDRSAFDAMVAQQMPKLQQADSLLAEAERERAEAKRKKEQIEKEIINQAELMSKNHIRAITYGSGREPELTERMKNFLEAIGQYSAFCKFESALDKALRNDLQKVVDQERNDL